MTRLPWPPHKVCLISFLIGLSWGARPAFPAANPDPALVRVQFMDSETGYVIPAGQISIRHPGEASAPTAAALVERQAEGRSQSIPSGPRSVQVTADRYLPWTGMIDVGDSDGPPVRIWLDPQELPPELRPDAIRRQQRADFTLILGFVVDDETGKPLEGVALAVGIGQDEAALEVESAATRTDGRGYFQMHVPNPPAGDGPAKAGCLVVGHPGYHSQRFSRIELWPHGDWTFRVRLAPTHGIRPVPSVLSDLLNSEVSEGLQSGTAGARPPSPPLENPPIPGPATGTIRLPRSIRVLTSDGMTIDYVSLEAYCRRVLPAEWIASWAAYPGGHHSLNAGAVAIRTYAIGAINHPRANHYDICGTTACQVYGPATSTYTDKAVGETALYVLTDPDGSIPAGLTEYSAENNSAGSPCGDGYTSPAGGCLADPVCAGQIRNGHGRGLCQWGSARWATGLKFPGNSTRDAITPNGYAQQDWAWILGHYYPALRLTLGAPLAVGDAVKALTRINVRACADASVSEGTSCPSLLVQPAGAAGIIVDGPVQVAQDGAGYTWYRVQWETTTGWSVENYLERLLDRPTLRAAMGGGGITLWWDATLGVTYRVQARESALEGTWQNVTGNLVATERAMSWSDPGDAPQRFYRVQAVISN